MPIRLLGHLWWAEKDSNLRTPQRTDLQSVAVAAWLSTHIVVVEVALESTCNDFQSFTLPYKLLNHIWYTTTDSNCHNYLVRVAFSH